MDHDPPLRRYINNSKLYDALEEIRELEAAEDSDDSKIRKYHRLVRTLPELISAHDLVKYHNILISKDTPKVKEIEEENKELAGENEKLEKELNEWKKLNDELTEKLGESNSKSTELLQQYKSRILDYLRAQCSPEAYATIETTIDGL